MPFLKKVEVRDLSSKYGHSHRGVIALEPIHAGETVFCCHPSSCSYYITQDPRNKLSRAEILTLIEAHPEIGDYIHRYAYMVDDDIFSIPRHYETQKITDECPLFNHSCDPNCGFNDGDVFRTVAISDVSVGEELTIHYGFFDSEASFWTGLKCKCGSKNCVGELKFDFWEDENWQNKFQQYASDYIQRKINNLRKDSKQAQLNSHLN